MNLFLSRALMGFFAIAALLVIDPSDAQAEEAEEKDESLITCTVRIEFQEELNEAFATGPTMEEASDAALESACALVCVDKIAGGPSPDEGGAAKPKAGEPAKTDVADEDDADEDGAEPGEGSSGSADDPQAEAIEACIEACASEAITIGTLCRDGEAKTIFTDGAFDSDAAPVEDP